MEDSEFVVVDDEHRGFMAINNLKETVQAYGAARDSLLKGVALLHDTLNLTMELALKNASPDFESDINELRKRVLGSLDSSSETVLRDHVKSLCSKLVAVKAEYEELAKKFEALNAEKPIEHPPQITRLAAIFDDIDALLPISGVGRSNAVPTTTGLDELCNRAESIRDRVKVAMTKPNLVTVTTSDLVSRDSEDLVENLKEPSTPKADSEMDYSFYPKFSNLNLVRRTSSEVSLHHQQYPLQYPQHAHATPPSFHPHQNQQYAPEFDRGHPLATSTRQSLLLDEEIRLPIGHVERLKKKLSASLILGTSLDNVPSDIRALPRQIPGAKELFRPPIASTPPTPPPRPIPQRMNPQSLMNTTSKTGDIVSLQKSVASLAAATALRRNISIQSKELIVDGCGGIKDGTVLLKLPPKRSVSSQTQTEPPGGMLPWWTFLEPPPWQRQNSMSFSATSSGIGVDDASNFQDDFSSISKTCFVCCKHNTFITTGRPHCCVSNCSLTCASSELLQEISRMVREEVATVLKSMEHQMKFIQQALKPPSDKSSTAPPEESVQDPPTDYCVVQESSPSTTNTGVEVIKKAETLSKLRDWSEASRLACQPMLLPVPPRLLVGRYGNRHAPIVHPKLLPTRFMPSSQIVSGSSRKTRPSFLPDDERPLCPKCQTWLPDRHALEVHLDTCLQ